MGSLFKPKQVGPTQEDVLSAAKPIDLFTPLGQATFGEGGAGTVEVSPVMQQWIDTLLGQAEAEGEAVEGYDPGQLGIEFYEKFQEPSLEKSLGKEFRRHEARTLAQGRLGATEGRGFLSDLLAAQEDIRLKTRGQSIAQAQQYKDLMRGRQLENLQQAINIMGLPSGLLSTGINAGQGRGQILSQYRPQYQESTGMKLLKMGAGIAGSLATGGAFGAGGMFGSSLAGAAASAAPAVLGGGISALTPRPGLPSPSYAGGLYASAPIGLFK